MADNGRTICTVCNYIYEDANGESRTETPAGTSFDALPAGWRCPECGSGKEMFQPCSCVSIEVYETTKTGSADSDRSCS